MTEFEERTARESARQELRELLAQLKATAEAVEAYYQTLGRGE